MKICSIPGCEKELEARGLCVGHYRRLRTMGNTYPDAPLGYLRVFKNPTWKKRINGEAEAKDGRVLIYSPKHPAAKTGSGYVYRYRLIMEQKLGRFLTSNEVVHHRNNIRWDDRLKNLELLTRAEHTLLHAVKIPAGQWALNHTECEQCGATERKHAAAGLCSVCHGRFRSDTLSDVYVKNALRRSGVTNPTQDQIETRRAQMLEKRSRSVTQFRKRR